MGGPVTWRIDSAAPPLASPSILVSTTPVRPADRGTPSPTSPHPARSWRPRQTEFPGVQQLLQRPHLVHQVRRRRADARPCRRSACRTQCSPPRGALLSPAAPHRRASCFALLIRLRRSARSIAFATTRNCSRAAGRYTSTDTSIGRWPPFFSHPASLPEVVVLPEPCSPAIRITLGGRDGLEARRVLAEDFDQLIVDNLTICSSGDSDVITSRPAPARECGPPAL